MANLDYEEFLKKYGLAINYLGKRMNSAESRAKLAQALYQDSMNNKINMSSVMNDVKMFYQGNTLSQAKLNNYIQKYK